MQNCKEFRNPLQKYYVIKRENACLEEITSAE